MSHAKNFKYVCALLMFSLLLVVCGPSKNEMGRSVLAQESTVPAEKPNVVLILTDDMASSDLKHMPKTNALLVKSGMRFSRAFSTYSLCCPSRATILRGQYAHNHEVYDNSPPRGGAPRFRSLSLDQSTVATWLNDAGYRTGHVGKYMNKYDGSYTPPGWDRWNTLYGAFHLNGTINDDGEKNRFSVPIEAALAKRATNFISTSDGPFYLQVGTHAPHSPASYPAKYRDFYSGATPPRYPSFNEAAVSDKPAWVRNHGRLTAKDQGEANASFRQRLRSLRAADDLVGQVVDSLRSTGELDNTYIFFSSDNGWHYGEHRLQGKWTPYTEAQRIPLVVRGPGVPENQIRSGFALNNDFAPTFADIAGAQTPDFVDGRSLIPLLSGPPPDSWRTRFLIEGWHNGADPLRSPPMYKGVRTDSYSYVEYRNGERELYNLRRDPYQLNSLHRTGNRDLVRTLDRSLSTLASCQGAECRAAEGE